MNETSMGLVARIDFVADTLRRHQVRSVIDIGSGTGEALTAPLARLFPDVQFLGVDSDVASQTYAKEQFKSVSNLSWSAEFPSGKVFDAVIASEVLEHVEDPAGFLTHVRSLMGPHSILIATFPNGYGSHELMSGLEVALQLSGIIPLAKRLLGKSSSRASSADAPETLAISPHINFFSYGKAMRLFRERGYRLTDYRGRMFLCTFLASKMIDRSPALIRWNIKAGRALPARLVADWMFVFQKDDSVIPVSATRYRRNAYERLRLKMNCKQQHVPVPSQWLR